MRFLASLAREDLSPATLRGYRYDLRHFLRWHWGVTETPFAPDRLAEYDLIAYRQQMIAAGRRPATINRRLEALRRLGRWAHGTGALATDVVRTFGRCAWCATVGRRALPIARSTPCCAPPAPPATVLRRAITLSFS